MEKNNAKTMETFDLSSIPNLDVAVLGSLELLSDADIPDIDFNRYKRPLVVGSGNGASTGRILFHDSDAVFAEESTYEHVLKAVPSVDGAVVISASGAKHAPVICKTLRDKGMDIMLLTCTPDCPAKQYVKPENFFVFPKQKEPYTYNVSTYMGMMLAKKRESPEAIIEFINNKVNPLLDIDFRKYGAYFVIVPDDFDLIRSMLTIKFIELFARNLARDVFTPEQTMHAKTVVPREDELFISFGYKNKDYGKHRLDIPLPKDPGFASMMAIGYYTVGRIQAAYPPFFKDSIAAYCKETSRIFGQDLKPIVE